MIISTSLSYIQSQMIGPNLADQLLNPSHIINALNTLHGQRSNELQIKMANNFLDECEKHPFFATTLLSIYSEASDFSLQLTSVILFINVIKRNWNPKRSASIIASIQPEIKEKLRKEILQAYFLHDMNYYKHFNALIGFLTHLDYPKQYKQLHQFIINSLNQLIEMMKINTQTVLKSNRVLSVLSTCKVVIKEYGLKKIAHTEEIFLQFITIIIQISINLSQELSNKLRMHLERNDTDSVVILLECLRKIDKVILYGIGSMPSLFQYKSQVKGIISSFVRKIEEFNELYHIIHLRADERVVQQLEKYLIGILEQLGKLQGYYNFLFSDFLKEYLYLILKMLVQNVPNPKYYSNQKLISIIIAINAKAIQTFVYSVSNEQYKKSIYYKKNSPINNLPIQQECHEKYRQIFTVESVMQLLNTIITQIMTAPHILKDYKEFSDEWVLEDAQISTVQAPTQTSNYMNCIDLVKKVLKRFKEQSLPLIVTMMDKVEVLKTCIDPQSRQILINILEVIITLPSIYENQKIPLDHICNVINSVYQTRLFGFLIKIIRKYLNALPLSTTKTCFAILAQIVATPINQTVTPEIIFQSALALKILMSEMEYEPISLETLVVCVSNIVSLVNMKEFLNCPTLMWPIITILIKFVKVIFDTNKVAIEQISKIIVQGLSELICSQSNEELVACALAELISSLIFCCYNPIKLQYNMRGKPFIRSQKMQQVSISSFIVFEAAFALLKNNIRNKYLQNNNIILRFWLTLMRTYPTIYTQQQYNIHLQQTNNKLADFFKSISKQILQKNPILFVELLEQYFITELIDLSPSDLSTTIQSCLSYIDSDNNVQILIALASLYYSYSLLKSPIMEILCIFFKYFVQYYRKITPIINSYRTFVFLILGQHMLTNSATELYNHFTNAFGGEFGAWFIPYLWSMHFVSNKFAILLNCKILIKSINDLGLGNFCNLLMVERDGEVAIDQFLRVITLQVDLQKSDSTYHSYNNIHRQLTNQISPDYELTFFRKIKLQISDHLMKQILETNIKKELKSRLYQIIRHLQWNEPNIQEHLREASESFNNFLLDREK